MIVSQQFLQTKRTQIIQLTFLLLLACSGKNENRKIEGDYYTKAIGLRFFDLPDTTLTAMETYFKTTPRDSMTIGGRKEYDYFEFLVEHNFLRRHYVRLLLDNGKKTVLFLDKVDYDRIEDLLKEVDMSEMKIRIEAEVDEIKIDTVVVYNALKLTTVEKRSGQTHYEK